MRLKPTQNFNSIQKVSLRKSIKKRLRQLLCLAQPHHSTSVDIGAFCYDFRLDIQSILDLMYEDILKRIFLFTSLRNLCFGYTSLRNG